jgi:hypothetical protein
VPSSFEGVNGSVRYIAQATIDRPWKFNHESRTAFSVINNLDLNLEPAFWKVFKCVNCNKDQASDFIFLQFLYL